MYNIINLLCGIGLFLIGMTLMSEYTTETFGEKLKDILSALTKNKISGVLTGLTVTGIIQSSCATTVTAVSFVSAGILSLSGAVGIVMGANIGTTVTSLIIAFNFSDIAPIAVFFGTILKMFSKKQKLQSVGMIIIGFGLLFIGLNTMASSFEALKDNPSFLSFIAKTDGRLQGVLTGFIMTAIMQSSSATVGILQALAMQGLVPVATSFYIILGQNIGAVVPVIISSAGTTKTAKQVSVIHLLFNLIGTGVFLIASEFIPFQNLFSFAKNDSMKISLFHIMFNVVSTVMLLPFSDLLLKISEHLTATFLFYKKEK
jgi:phosphate:Na+ symporter